MTSNDPITGLLDQLAAHREQVTRLDTREAEHHAALSGQLTELARQAVGISRTLQEYVAAIARLTATSPADAEPDGYRPGPAPTWWKLPSADRQEPVARLRAWVEQVYRPGYGHLAATLGPLLGSARPVPIRARHPGRAVVVLYLQPRRGAALVSAQAEYQARILPALTEQLRIETNRCGHPRSPAPAGGQPWSMP